MKRGAQEAAARAHAPRSRLIRRAMFDTVVMNHPAGTLVTPVTVGRDLPPSVSQ